MTNEVQGYPKTIGAFLENYIQHSVEVALNNRLGIDIERVGSHESRLQRLEQQQIIDNKTRLDSVIDYHTYKKDLNKRIKELEEWKNNHIDNHNRHGWYDLETKKVIDKKVWDDIKSIVSCREYWAGEFGRAVQHNLIREIKNVDPEFCPND